MGEGGLAEVAGVLILRIIWLLYLDKEAMEQEECPLQNLWAEGTDAILP